MSVQPEIWRRSRSEQVADCRVFTVRKDFCERVSDRKTSTFFVVENPDWVNVIGLTRENEVVMIEQFRHGSEEIILEIPGGMIDEGEDPLTAARREFIEETGFSAEKFIFLGESRPNPAIQNNTLYHYLAVGCQKTQETAFDENESITTRRVPLSEIENLIRSGAITHSLVVAAFYYLSLNKDYEN